MVTNISCFGVGWGGGGCGGGGRGGREEKIKLGPPWPKWLSGVIEGLWHDLSSFVSLCCHFKACMVLSFVI